MSAPLASVRVLIVDDDVDVRLGLRSLLRSLGYQVEEAENGDQGLSRIVAARPDLALIDLAMEGGLDGYELARRLRATPEGRTLKLVALTGHSRREERVRALEAGFDRVLVKPVSERELTLVLSECVTAS